jgi:cysteine desulfurase
MSAPVRIYLDNAATTRPLPAVLAAMQRTSLECFGNPSSSHSFGPPAKRALEDAREFLRGTLGAARVVFTSGGSEADYLGIVGSAAARAPGRVLMSAADHPALLQCTTLLGRYRHVVSALPVTPDGDLAPETLFEALGQDVRVVALMYGHNELGTLGRLPDLVELVRRTAPTAHVHVDLVQTYGKLPFDLDAAGVDSVAVSGHKFHGPRGVGFLALSSTAEVMPHTERLAARMFAAVADALPDAVRLGHAERRLPHILSMRLPGVVGQTLALRCDARGVAFSTGSACHGAHDDDRAKDGKDKGDKKADNHVLAAIGLDRRQAREVVRVSFCGETTTSEADAATAILVDETTRLLAASPRDLRSGAAGR